MLTRRRRAVPVLVAISTWTAIVTVLFLYWQYRNGPHGTSDPDWLLFSWSYRQRYSRDPPPLLQQWVRYAVDNRCDLNGEEFYGSIEHDLERFRERGLTRQDVVSAYVKLREGEYGDKIRYWTLDDDVFPHDSLRHMVEPLLKVSASIRHIPMIFNFRDEPLPLWDAEHRMPVFSFCNRNDRTDNIRYPFPHSFGHEMKEVIPTLPLWADRKRAVVWRGSATGSTIGRGDWRNTMRFHLVKRFGANGTVVHGVPIDIGFKAHGIGQCDSEQACDIARAEYPTRDTKPFAWFADYQYVVDVDGNAFSVRFPQLMRIGAVVLKAGNFKQWFSDRVRPWVHYIPMNASLDDLPDRVAWAVSHPEESQRISASAADLANTHLRDADARCYLFRLLVEYASLFHGS